MVGLVRAVAAMETANLGRHAVVGGLAVCARLNQAHRATADVDTVVDETMPPDAVSALLLLDDTRPDPTANHRVYINGTKVEILGVGPIGEAEDLSWATDADGLFVRAHTWALDSAGSVRVVSGDDPAVQATAPFATPGALVAMKLHAIESRSTAGLDKRAGDAWDIYRILVDLDADGAVRAELRAAPVALRDLVRAAVDRVLVTGAPRTRGWMRTAEDVVAAVTADELRLVGEVLLGALS